MKKTEGLNAVFSYRNEERGSRSITIFFFKKQTENLTRFLLFYRESELSRVSKQKNEEEKKGC